MEDYEVVIGLEVHAQLQTSSKMFCGCSAGYANADPNTLVCPVCLGMPGVLPTINEDAVRYTVMTALALSCSIPEYTKFDRKNYMYPDLMKGYQISQYDAPMSRNGQVTLDTAAGRRIVRINRVHLEEDTARLLHRSGTWGDTYSLVDVNRSGVPLMEIVSEPDIRSAEEARQYLIKLRSILRYLGVSTGNMEEGSFRCDANISLRPRGQTEYGAKVEVKNMNSFRSVFRALEFEIDRQKGVLSEGGRIHQETRGWVEEKAITVSQRSKEYAHDYRYFPEPDLPPLAISPAWVEELRTSLPELPDAKRDRFVVDFHLSEYDADLLVSDKEMAHYFEQAQALAGPAVTPKAMANWILGDMSRLLKSTGAEITESKVTPERLVQLLDLIEKGTISGKIAKSIFEEMFNTGKSPSDLVEAQGVTQISDQPELEAAVERAIAGNANAVADYRAGKKQSLAFLVGQVMKDTKGRANPALVNELLRRRLD